MKKSYEVIKSESGAFPMGVHIYRNRVHFAVEASGEAELVLCLYHAGELTERIEFPQENRLGDIRYMDVSGLNTAKLEYSFEFSDGTFVRDNYAKRVYGWEKWGEQTRNEVNERYGFVSEDFNWEDDVNPHIPLNEMIIYRLHVRGFTKHASSKAKGSGKFLGIAEKIPYLKELGITTVELMIPVEFNEVRKLNYNFNNNTGNGININYWGYGENYHFAPKAAYARKNPVTEFRELVKALHRAGLEIVIELNFGNRDKVSYILECMRYWAECYHVDGIKVNGSVPLSAISQEPALKNIKLFAAGWDGCEKRRNLISCNDKYMNDMRRFLKGDENTLNSYLENMTANPRDGAVVNFFADNNTFTMMDMVSYDVKHNELNGENNRDGQDYNFSWNCGFEGHTRKKKIVDLRRQLLYDAFAMLFLSQGIPMLRAGDEMGQSKNGNNNAYCQDNRISWINWRQLSLNSDIYSFVKSMIAFRKAHDLFHKELPLREDDYDSMGMPEFSIHGVNPWYPQYEHFRRQLGLLYFGGYSVKKNEKSYYFIVNMHWETHEFLIPGTPGKEHWKVILDTSLNGQKPDEISELSDGYVMQPRSAAILETVGRKEIC